MYRGQVTGVLFYHEDDQYALAGVITDSVLNWELIPLPFPVNFSELLCENLLYSQFLPLVHWGLQHVERRERAKRRNSR